MTAVEAVPLIMQAIGHIAFVLTGTTQPRSTSIFKRLFGQGNNRTARSRFRQEVSGC
jgi:hypothetical protein